MIKICTSTFHEAEAPTKSPLPKSRKRGEIHYQRIYRCNWALIGRRFVGWQIGQIIKGKIETGFEMSTVCCQHTLTRLCECMDGADTKPHDFKNPRCFDVYELSGSSIINRLIYWTIHFVGSNRLDNTILTRLHASCVLTGWLHSNRRTADRRCVGSCSPTGAQHILLHSVQELLLG